MSIVIKFSKKGSTCGFTAKGETVTGCYSAKSKSWKIAVHNDIGIANMADDRNRNFASFEDSAAYAQSIVDAAATQRLAWWPIDVSL